MEEDLAIDSIGRFICYPTQAVHAQALENLHGRAIVKGMINAKPKGLMDGEGMDESTMEWRLDASGLEFSMAEVVSDVMYCASTEQPKPISTLLRTHLTTILFCALFDVYVATASFSSSISRNNQTSVCRNGPSIRHRPRKLSTRTCHPTSLRSELTMTGRVRPIPQRT